MLIDRNRSCGIVMPLSGDRVDVDEIAGSMMMFVENKNRIYDKMKKRCADFFAPYAMRKCAEEYLKLLE